MLMYRPCRETYEESLKDVAMFESVETMFYQIYEGDEFSVREVISKSILSIGDPIGDDDQIGWKDVKPVVLNLRGEEQKCIGYCTMEVDREFILRELAKTECWRITDMDIIRGIKKV